MLTHQQQTAFESIVGKGEMAHNEPFLLIPQCFLLNQITVSLNFSFFLTSYLNFSAELEDCNSLPCNLDFDGKKKKELLKHYGKRRKCLYLEGYFLNCHKNIGFCGVRVMKTLNGYGIMKIVTGNTARLETCEEI